MSDFQPPVRSAGLAAARRSTAELHSQVEARIGRPGPGFDRTSYQRLLAAFWGVHVPLDRAMRGLYDGDFLADGLARNWRTQALFRDLADLGMTTDEINRLPLAEVSLTTDPIEGLGWGYMREGSTLGGQVLVRLVVGAVTCGPVPTAFLTAYGADTPARWADFMSDAERQIVAAGAAASERFATGAAAAFTFIDRWLDQRGYHVSNSTRS